MTATKYVITPNTTHVRSQFLKRPTHRPRSGIEGSVRNQYNAEQRTKMVSTSLAAQPVPTLWQMYKGVVLWFLSVLFPVLDSPWKVYLATILVPLTSLSTLYSRVRTCRKERKSRLLCYIYSMLLIILLILFLLFFVGCIKISQQNIKYRLEAFPEAMDAIREGIKNNRIHLEEGYDLYLPPNFSGHPTDTACRVAPAGLVLFPGALLDHRAYGRVASQLSDMGVLVVVQDDEPIRLPAPILGSNTEFVENAIKGVKEKHNIEVLEWSVGGHSLGAKTAADIITNMEGIKKLVLWAQYGAWGIDLAQSDVDVLLITATEDGYYFPNDEVRQKLFEKLPPRAVDSNGAGTVHLEIIGGNHGGFADYEKQVFYKVDGERKISLEEQQRQVIQSTAQFLIGNTKV